MTTLVAHGGQCRFVPCDVGDPELVQQVVAQEAGGGIDVVFANAAIGTITVGGTIESIEPDRWDVTFAVNTRGVYALCRAALPHLSASGGGSIVVTSSISAVIGSAARPTHAYAASKGALLSLVRAMAVTYGPAGDPGQRHPARLRPHAPDRGRPRTARFAGDDARDNPPAPLRRARGDRRLRPLSGE